MTRSRYVPYEPGEPDDDPGLIGRSPVAPTQTRPAISTDLRGLLRRAGYRVEPPHTGSIAVAVTGKRAT